MRTATAAAYVDGSKWKILRAVEAGLLKPAGKQGRSLTFTKQSLDEFMLGEPANETAPINTPSRRSSSTTSTDALATIAAIAKTGKAP